MVPHSFLRPSLALASISALIIGGSLFVFSAIVAATVVDPNPFALMGSLVILPLSIVLAAQQYRGTFRLVPSAAKTTSLLLNIFGGFLVFAGVTTAGEAILEGISWRLFSSLLIPMFGAAALSLAAGRMNSRWSDKLHAAIASGITNPQQSAFTLRELMLAVGVIAVMTGITAQFVGTAPPPFAEHVDAAAAPVDLPDGATDVSYGKGHRGTIAYEFTIDEARFRDWVKSGIGSIEAQSAGIPLQEITSSCTITRYYTYSGAQNGLERIAIDNGLYYSWSKEDRGVYAAFDRTTERAYYHAHYH